ncbi:MAG: ketopantoate reductase C-terminal domain-containing protein, partial [Phycisphaerae bacterium]|nr:ketopantoate reductase C-terminal domain-containing protein [Phycisphaerae bacterium]
VAEEVDILPLVWGKAVVNSAINPICGLARVSNGELLKRKPLRELADAVCLEGQHVARAAGIRLPYKSAYEVVQRTCRQTSANRCSMLQDMEAGRETEIEFLNGALCRIASQHGVTVPVNWTLTQIIRWMGKRKSP